MAEECKEAASGCAAEALPLAAAAPPGDVEMSDCPAAAAEAGAPMVCDGPIARLDSAGKPACELCGTRWTRCKGKLHPHPPGKICHACWKIREGIRSPPSAGAPPAPDRSHKRKLHAAPIAAVAQPLSPLPPPPPPSPFHQPLWHSHGWSLHTSSRSSRGAAASWLQLAQSDELKQWKRKRGGFYQHDTHPSLVCSFLDEKHTHERAQQERRTANHAAAAVRAEFLRGSAAANAGASRGAAVMPLPPGGDSGLELLLPQQCPKVPDS